ncbi:hypothetical protein Tco_1527683, partial [Tanacetum coccineum]
MAFATFHKKNLSYPCSDIKGVWDYELQWVKVNIYGNSTIETTQGAMKRPGAAVVEGDNCGDCGGDGDGSLMVQVVAIRGAVVTHERCNFYPRWEE